MRAISIASCSIAALVSGVAAYTPAETYRFLQNADIVPGLLPNFAATAENFLLTYGNVSADWGNTSPLAAVAAQPQISFGADQNATKGNATRYTVVMFDPDAPTPQNPNASLIRHWTVANLGPRGVNLSDTATLSPYLSPSPPAGSDPHRYIFALFRQPATGTVSLFNQSSSPRNFQIAPFINQNNLTLINANFFRAVRSANGTSVSAAPRASGSGTANTGSGSGSGAGTTSSVRASGSAGASGAARTSTPANTSDAAGPGLRTGAIATLMMTASFVAMLL